MIRALLVAVLFVALAVWAAPLGSQVVVLYGFGGTALWTPDDISGLTAFYDGRDDSSVTHTTNNVSGWADQTANGYDLTSTGGTDPVYSDANDTIQFSNSQMDVAITHSSVSNLSAAIIASSYTPLSNGRFLTGRTVTVDYTPPYHILMVGYNSGMAHYGNNGYRGINESESIATAKIIVSIVDNLVCDTYIDGVQGGTSGSTVAIGNTHLVLGGDGGGNGDGNMTVHAVLYHVNAAWSANRRACVEGWAAHEFGYTADLPAGHDYKTDPPTEDDTCS